MPRKPRFQLPGVPQHIIQRGNNRQPCFLTAGDYRRYLDYLCMACEKFDCIVHAYVLMTNHVHLLLTPVRSGAVGPLMQSIGRGYVRYVNDTYRRTGTLWEGRYKASLVEDETYLLTCYRYIELNPVRARMVWRPGDYRWSSYAYNALGRLDPGVTPHSVYLRLGSDPESRRQTYRGLFRTGLGEEQLRTIRDTLNEELVLGSERFKDSIETTLKRRARRGKAGRPRQVTLEGEQGKAADSGK